MKQLNVRPGMLGLYLLAVLTCLTASALAGSSWQWETSLQVNDVGDSMYMPSAVAFDRESERYYVVDTGRSRLVSFERDGKVVRAFTANDQLKAPFDMVRLDSGQLWVVEKGRNSLTYIDIAARKIQPNTLRDGNRLVFPDRIAVAGGKLHILDRSSGMVLRLAEDLSIDQRFGCKDCSAGMIDFTVDGSSVLALEPREKQIYRFKADGSIAEKISLGDEIDFPVSFAVGDSGYFYVLDRHRNSVLVFSEDGQFRYSLLGPGQAPGKIYFSRQLRFDPWGRLCVVDEGNGRVEIFSQ